MNKRLKELAEQCYVKFESLDAYHFDREKFAKMIVKECVSVLTKRYMGDQNREDMEVRRCIDDVNKHFGVEDD